MEDYKKFLNRIYSFEKSEFQLSKEDFKPNPSLLKKVNLQNRFSNFYGDTIVFDLDKNTKDFLFECTDRLCKEASECFCERLIPDTFHMTLHDLSNSPQLSDIAEEVFCNEINLITKLRNESFLHKNISMESTCVFNMVNTSLVMGLKPVNENEYNKLIKLYSLVDCIKVLPYPLTPHITLTYYNRNGFSAQSAKKLETVVNELNKNKLTIELDINKLFYQKFSSMNNYINVFKLF